MVECKDNGVELWVVCVSRDMYDVEEEREGIEGNGSLVKGDKFQAV